MSSRRKLENKIILQRDKRMETHILRAILKPENRNPDSGIRNQNPESGIRNPESGILLPVENKSSNTRTFRDAFDNEYYCASQ